MSIQDLDTASDAPASIASQRLKYQRVCDHVYAEIHSGRWLPGQTLPAESKLAESLGLSRQTVRQAFAELENDGVIVRIRGRGTFVATEHERQSRQQLNMFALVAPQVREGSYPSLINGFEQACSGFQHQAVVSNTGNCVDRQANIILQLIDQSVAGVALVPTTSEPTPEFQIAQLRKNHVPVVYCHRPVAGIPAPSVVFDGHEIGLVAGRTLAKLGHRRIGILFANRYSMVTEREQGLRDALVEYGGGQVIPIEYGGETPTLGAMTKKAIHESLTKVLSSPGRPTAIFCGSVPTAEQVCLHAESLGLAVPRDLSVLYFGGTWREHGFAESISAIAVDEHEMGACAARLLHEMRTGKRAMDNDEQIVFPISELPGETLGPAPEHVAETKR